MKALDPVLKMLFLGIIFFTGVLFVSERFFPMDGQIFQVVAGLLTGFSGAFFMGIKKELGIQEEQQPSAVSKRVQTTTIERTETPPPINPPSL